MPKLTDREYRSLKRLARAKACSIDQDYSPGDSASRELAAKTYIALREIQVEIPVSTLCEALRTDYQQTRRAIQTLSVHGHVVTNGRPPKTPPPIMKTVVQKMKERQLRGMSVTRKELTGIVNDEKRAFFLANGLSGEPNWQLIDSRPVERTLRREGITFQSPSIRCLERMRVSKDEVSLFLKNLATLCRENHYHPSMIVNADETGVWGRNETSNLQVATGKTVGQPRRVQTVAPKHLTAMVMINADGQSAPVLVIVPFKNLTVELCEANEYMHFDFVYQVSGSMTKLIFADWVENRLIPFIQKMRAKLNGEETHNPINSSSETSDMTNDEPPTDDAKYTTVRDPELRATNELIGYDLDLHSPSSPDSDTVHHFKHRALLVIDGHNSRSNVEALQLMRQNGIDCLMFPAHMSHLIQPLDLNVFFHLKRFLKQREHTAKWVRMLEYLHDGLQQSLIRTYIFASWKRSKLLSDDASDWLDHEDVIVKPRLRKRRRAVNLKGGEIATSDDVIRRFKEWRESHPQGTRVSRKLT